MIIVVESSEPIYLDTMNTGILGSLCIIYIVVESSEPIYLDTLLAYWDLFV